MAEPDAFSRRFLAWLEATAPEYAARVQPFSPWKGAVALRLAVPRDDGTASDLVVTTHNEELTIEFDFTHGHFMPAAYADEAACFADAWAHVRQFMAEELLAVAWWLDAQCKGGQWLRRGEPVPPGPGAIASALLGRPNRVTVRSWRGTYDRDYVGDALDALR